MTQQDFLNLWFNNQTIQQRTILNSSAFAMPVQLPEGKGTLSWTASSAETDQKQYPVTLLLQDGVEEILFSIDRLNHFPRLEKALLLSESIPEELLLSIAAAEFAQFAPWMGENLTVRKVLSSTAPANTSEIRTFKIDSAENGLLLQGAVTVTAGLEERWGKIDNLNIPDYFSENPSSLPAIPCYAGFKLSPEELQTLKPGDRLLLPEWNLQEKSANCLLIADGRFGARARQEDCNIKVQAPWQPFQSEQDELLIGGQHFPLAAQQAYKLLEEGSELQLSLLSSARLFLYKNGQILAEGIPGEISGSCCMEITGVEQA